MAKDRVPENVDVTVVCIGFTVNARVVPTMPVANAENPAQRPEPDRDVRVQERVGPGLWARKSPRFTYISSRMDCFLALYSSGVI
jgi:hypothetical protein